MEKQYLIMRLILLASRLCLQLLHPFFFLHFFFFKSKSHVLFKSGLFHFTGWESHS